MIIVYAYMVLKMICVFPEAKKTFFEFHEHIET